MRYLQANSQLKKVNLDLKDQKLLGNLSLNARIPFTQLAKKIGLSRDSVQYRVNALEKSGVIQGYRSLVDMDRLGFNSFHLFFKLSSPSKDSEQHLIAHLVRHPFVRAIIKFSGNYDLEIALVAKDIQELDYYFSLIMKDCSSMVQDYELLTITKGFVAETFPPNFYSQKKYPSQQKKGKADIDKKDLGILKLLGEQAKLPLYEVGEKVGLSADSVAYRLKQMISSGVIVKFIPVINYASLSYNLHTILLQVNGFDEIKEKTLLNLLYQDKNTLWAVKTLGRFNVLIYLLVKNIDELQQTIMELRGLFSGQISHYESLIAYEEYKYTYFPQGLF